MKTHFASLLLIICFSTIISAQKKYSWIDKEENEDYVARHECSFVQSGNTFIMFGGRESAKQLDIYDYSENTWSKGTEAPVEFNHFQATEYQGLIWIIGAFETNNYPNEIPASYIYMYNPGLQKWIKGPEIPEDRRRGGSGLVVYNDKFYLVGGNTKGHNGGYIPWTDVYDPVANTWEQLPDAPHSRDHFSAVLKDDKIYAVSGRLSGGEGGVLKPLIAEVDIYDIPTRKWSTLDIRQNLQTPRAGAAVALFQDEIFVMGGEVEHQKKAYKRVEAYNFEKKKWKKKKDMNYGRHGTQAIVSGNGIYIAGGSPVKTGGNQKNMEVYGVDEPKGEAIVASDLIVADELILNEGSKEIELTISNENGTTGIFIQNIQISGQYKDLFTVKGNFKNRLLKIGDQMELLIENKAVSNFIIDATITIIYDQDLKKEVKITVKP